MISWDIYGYVFTAKPETTVQYSVSVFERVTADRDSVNYF